MTTLEPVAAMAARSDAALATFRRAMRRYERRARRMGLAVVAGYLRDGRILGSEPWPYDWTAEDLRKSAASMRGQTRAHAYRRAAFLYERAADAVARLREATS